MQSTNVPAGFPAPFAINADASHIRDVPQGSQVSVTPGAASLSDGFPPLNFLPVSAGGIPPSGLDFNGILKRITQAVQWLQAGGPMPYNAAFAAAVGGYPKGTLVMSADQTTLWQSTVENNTANPDAGGGNWIAFTPPLGSFACLTGFNGYQKLPSGLLLQWGATGVVGSGTYVTFPTAFPHTTLNISVTNQAGAAPTTWPAAGNLSATGFTLWQAQSSGVGQGGAVYWHAIGY